MEGGEEPSPLPTEPAAEPETEQAAEPAASVMFKMDRHVAYGHQLKVVGGLPQLGDWDCEKAPGEPSNSALVHQRPR